MFFVIFFSFILLCILIIGVRAVIEPYRPDFTFYQIGKKPISHTSNQRINISDTAIRVLFFSDFHYPLEKISIETIYHFAIQEKADIVIFGGDMVSHQKDLKEGQYLANRLASLLKQKNIPMIAIVGNHDKGLSQKDANYPLLINQHFIFTDRNNYDWKFIGLDDIRIGKMNLETALSEEHPASIKQRESHTRKTDNNTSESARSIYLAHNPDSILHLDSKYAKVCLSGHFHGGQIKLLGLEYKFLREEVLCRTKHVAGLFQINHMNHFISRGFGSVLFPFRLGAKPEITLLEIYPQNKQVESQESDQRIEAYVKENGMLYPKT